jgi:molecular chaperone DnaJ
VIKDPCKSCQGSGRQQEEKSLAVNIPAGVEDGTRIRLAGEGEAGLRGAPPGDLYIFISVQPHRMFQRQGQDLYCEVPITFATAALGGEIDVPSVEGKRLKLAIPAGTQTGRQFRVRDKGMVELQGKRRGDMFVEVTVETPVHLTKRQQELLREFEGAGKGGDTHSPQSSGFFAKMKELWDDLRD